MERRVFLKQSGVVSLGLLASSVINPASASGNKNTVILIVSGWQDINIGDIAHTPGLLALLQKHIPGAKLMLWEKSESKRVDEMLLKTFPVLSMECHSPIIAAANGTPSFYLRQPTDTIKGQMYYDLGFNDWVFEIDNSTGKQISDRLMEVNDDYPKALKNLKESMKLVDERYNEVFKIIN